MISPPRPRLRPVVVWLLLIAGGSASVAPSARAQPDPAQVGQWSGVQNWPIVAVHAHLLPTGKVLFYSYADDPHVWDPATGSITPLPKAGFNIFCSGHSFLADGTLLVTGGHIENGWGPPYAILYNPFNNTWSRRLPDMNNGRWYPTNTTLPNGDVLVVSGSYDIHYTNNDLPQVWQVGIGAWRDLSTARRGLPLYPFMLLAPNGKVFYAGPERTSRYLDTTGTGLWTTVAVSNFGYRDYGTATMYDDGKVLLVGGHDPPTATAEVIDLNAATPAWRYVAPMSIPRRQHNVTLLPDGKVLVTGGSSASGFNNPDGRVLYAEMWDPATERWTTLASYTRYRGYHSTAVLLPDGRVLSAGGDGQPNAEIFSPPYLFKGARPTITSAPAAVTYGQTFLVETPDAASIRRISLIRLTSVTHAFNQEQRIHRLNFAAVSGGLSVVAPSSANLCPPGYYMLFILNGNGVPSVARIVNVGVPKTPKAPTDLSAKAVSRTRIDLAWVDNADNEDGFAIERSRDGTTWREIKRVRANVTKFVNRYLRRNTLYYYRVRAFNAQGYSDYSNVASARTLP